MIDTIRTTRVEPACASGIDGVKSFELSNGPVKFVQSSLPFITKILYTNNINEVFKGLPQFL